MPEIEMIPPATAGAEHGGAEVSWTPAGIAIGSGPASEAGAEIEAG